MNQLINLEKLNNASYFTKNTLQQFVNVNDNSLSENIKRWLKKGILIQLKNGFYVTGEYFKNIKNTSEYVEFIANILKHPSYLSLEYVLQKYSVLSESVFAITSITMKKTGQFNNKLGYFTYSNIKDGLFTGYNIVTKGMYEIKEATKSKALFDYLYLKLLKEPVITKGLLASFRLNLDEFKQIDFNEFESYIKKSGIKKFIKIKKILIELKK